MADPRNIAHDKKVQDEKKHHGEEVVEGAAVVPQPGKKPPIDKEEVDKGIEHPHPHGHPRVHSHDNTTTEE